MPHLRDAGGNTPPMEVTMPRTLTYILLASFGFLTGCGDKDTSNANVYINTPSDDSEGNLLRLEILVQNPDTGDNDYVQLVPGQTYSADDLNLVVDEGDIVVRIDAVWNWGEGDESSSNLSTDEVISCNIAAGEQKGVDVSITCDVDAEGPEDCDLDVNWEAFSGCAAF